MTPVWAQDLAVLPGAQDGSKLLGSSDLLVSAFPLAKTERLTPIDLFKEAESIGFLLDSFT